MPAPRKAKVKRPPAAKATYEPARRGMDTLAERVLLLRRRERHNQQELATILGCSPATISNIEQGKLSTVSVEHQFKLADHFGVSFDFLFGREPERTPTVQASSAAEER